MEDEVTIYRRALERIAKLEVEEECALRCDWNGCSCNAPGIAEAALREADPSSF